MITRGNGYRGPVPTPERAISIVMISHNRCADVVRTLPRLLHLWERPRIVLVDNASTDATLDVVQRVYPAVETIALDRNMGAAGRNVGVRAARTPFVAFADDDSWWEPGALARAATLLRTHPRLAVVAGEMRAGSRREIDPTCLAMARSPLGTRRGHPGPSVLGFIACGAVVRAAPFLAVGGFPEMLRVGGEESIVAFDLASDGWGLCYAADVVAIHEPSAVRDASARQRTVMRNAIWTSWLRRRFRSALRDTSRLAIAALRDSQARSALMEALFGATTALRDRRPVPPTIERQLTLLDRMRSSE
jgi:GT2 family glycosyltransferase